MHGVLWDILLLTVYFSGSEHKKHSANGKSQRLHQMLDCILESFKAAQLPVKHQDLTGAQGESGQFVCSFTIHNW
jgi:hypothetical protein